MDGGPKSVFRFDAEVHPSLFRRRYPNTGRSSDEHDAGCVTAWLRETDRRNLLDHDFHPPLIQIEQEQAALEGWILGIC